MNFRKWLEDNLGSAFSDDPELNGLSRGLAHYKPVPKTKNRRARAIDSLFGKITIPNSPLPVECVMESTDTDYGAGFVFTDGKKILLLLRSEECSNPYTWGLPGGHAQKEETLRETANRECQEEIGIIKGETFYTSKEPNGWIFYFNKVDKPFKCKLNNEHMEYKWVNFDDLDHYDLHPMLTKKISHYVSVIKSHLDGAK